MMCGLRNVERLSGRGKERQGIQKTVAWERDTAKKHTGGRRISHCHLLSSVLEDGKWLNELGPGSQIYSPVPFLAFPCVPK